MPAGPKVRCCHCGDVIQSMYRHDFRACSCGRIAVDGGSDYLKVSFREEGDYKVVGTEKVSDDTDFDYDSPHWLRRQHRLTKRVAKMLRDSIARRTPAEPCWYAEAASGGREFGNGEMYQTWMAVRYLLNGRLPTSAVPTWLLARRQAQQEEGAS